METIALPTSPTPALILPSLREMVLNTPCPRHRATTSQSTPTVANVPLIRIAALRTLLVRAVPRTPVGEMSEMATTTPQAVRQMSSTPFISHRALLLSQWQLLSSLRRLLWLVMMSRGSHQTTFPANAPPTITSLVAARKLLTMA